MQQGDNPEVRQLKLAATVRATARALRTAGLVTAYGHCSARIDSDSFLVGPPKPPGNTDPREACSVVPIGSSLPTGILGEVRAHQQIYARRTDVGGICRFYSESLMKLSVLDALPLPRDVFSAYFAPEVPLWRDPLLLRSDARAAGVAERLGDGRAIVLRGNGAITVGSTLPEALTLAWMLDHSANIELALVTAGARDSALKLEPDEAAELGQFAGREVERLWDFLTKEDEEADLAIL